MHARTQISSIPGNGIREIVDIVLNRPSGSVARLEVGEPDSAPPGHVVEAAQLAAASGIGYTQSVGTQQLRSALADRVRRDYAMDVEEHNVIVTQGAVQAILMALTAVVGPGDEVLVPDPAWPNYEMQTLLLGGTAVHYALRPEAGFLPDADEVESLITPRTRVLVLNSPSNPAGSVIPAPLMKRLVELAVSRGILVISDEVYDEIVFDGHHVGARQFAPDSVVSVFSFSKTYSMTGWRVGYAIVPDWLAETAVRIQETTLSCISGVSQAAALSALLGPQDSVTRNLESYRMRRDFAVSLLAEHGVQALPPSGAFYLMAPLGVDLDTRAAALELAGAGVGVAPGSAFGTVAQGFVRLSLASSPETIATGIERIAAWRAKVGA